MRLKGDLESISLTELFQTLASQRATGVLTVTSPVEQKVVAISSGEIAVLADKLAERTRLGDLLIARGRLTESQLAEALKVQRQSEQRTRLGDLLVKTGLIKPEDIEASLKFQMEEELYDLFTWKKATFEFDGDRSIEEACADDLGESHMKRLSIEPQAVIAEASRRMVEWDAIEQRLPSPYLCFKLTPKGEELASKSNTVTQRIVNLLKEGRTIESTVKRSCAGRLNVCQGIVKLLDEGWVFPYPAAELQNLAAEHRARGRFPDALYIYRRLIEATDNPAEQRELQSLINDTLDVIRKALEAGQSVEGADSISYKEAAARYRRRQALKRITALLFLGAALIAATVVVSQAYRPPAGLHEDYQEAMKSAAEAVAKNRFEEAARIWEAFYRKLPDKEGTTAKLVMEHLSNLPLQSNAYMEAQLTPIAALEKDGKLNEAEAGYKRLLAQSKDSPYVKRMEEGLERIAEKRKELAQEQRLAALRKAVEKALELLQQKKYAAAQPELLRIAAAAAPDSAERQKTDQALQQLKDVEARVQKAVAEAEAEVRGQRGEKAIESFDAAAAEWPELPVADTARKQSQRLKTRLQQAHEDLKSAEAVAGQGGLIESLDALQRVERDYAEFELKAHVAARIAALTKQVDALAARLTEAQTEYARDKTRGRQKFAALLREQPAFMNARKARVPVAVTSQPSGASVSIDGVALGVTPLDITVTAGTPFTLRAEKPRYEPSAQQVARLAPENLLTIHFSLSRSAMANLEFKPGIFAPPRVFGGQLYILHGTTLSVRESLSGQPAWSLPNLLDDTATTRPNPDGSGAAQFVNDRSWWYPRTAPEEAGPGKLLLPLRSREIIEIDTANHSFRKLLSLPVEPVGRPCLQRTSLLAGKALLAVGCADGKIRAYELDKPAAPIWEKPADPLKPAPQGTLATGLSARTNGTFVVLSLSGRLTSFNMVNGQENWSAELRGPLAPANRLPATPQENLVALVNKDGGVTVFDLSQREKVWELPVAQALDEVSDAAVGGDGIYVITREGVVLKYPRGKCAGKPAALWRKPLDGATEMPLCAGQNVYAVSTYNTLYALSAGDGTELWKFKVEGVPTHLVEDGKLLYVATKEGRLLILATE